MKVSLSSLIGCCSVPALLLAVLGILFGRADEATMMSSFFDAFCLLNGQMMISSNVCT